MADFLDGLGKVLSQQFNLGDNNLHNLDIVKDGHVQLFGKLGNFANKFDQSAERSYTEEGWYRHDLANPHPRQLEILMQEPDITVLIKKRAFSSLADNYRTDLANDEERLFLRATKLLFQNKCKQIGAYEKLTKIETVSSSLGRVDYHLLPVIFGLTDTLSTLNSATGNFPLPLGFDKFKSIIDKVRTITNLSENAAYTSWITNTLDSFRSDLGEGTGVIELTTTLSINTSTSVEFGGGRASISFADPYKLMLVTNNDIEQAIADAASSVYGNSFFQLGLDTLNQSIDLNKKQLEQKRAARGANPINFLVNTDTFLGKRIRAIIDNSGIEIQFTGSILNTDVDPAYFKGGQVAGNDGLSTDELTNFQQIISATYNLIQLNQNARAVSLQYNNTQDGQIANRVRNKLRLHYGGKPILQVMDVVHIYATSRSQLDNKILGGLQDALSGVGFLQGVNKAMVNLQEVFNISNDASIEKSIFVGDSFPSWLWLILRNQFTTDKSGTHIFAGIIKSSNSHFDTGSGTHTVRIEVADNTAYFDFGVINFKPAAEVFDGSLYDPLTPFDIKFDKATGLQPDSPPELLKENKNLFKSEFVKYKNGIFVGRKPTEKNFGSDAERIQNNKSRRVYYDPDGMVYKWKEGIGSVVMFGNNYSATPADNQPIPTFLNDPFAGQDVMNSLALLITGEPYNYATFYRAALNWDNFGRDTQTGQDPATSYLRNLQSDLKYKNLIYGNFVPFKRTTINQESLRAIINNQLNVQAFDADLNNLLQDRAQLNDKLLYLIKGGINLSQNTDGQLLQSQLNGLDEQIHSKIQSINDSLNKINKPITLIGNDVSFDANSFIDPGNKNELSKSSQRQAEIRKKIHYLTRRMAWKVRANEDINLFIVDDSYDKDYDIQAFEKSFTNINTFKSDYITVSQEIQLRAKLLDLEVFADTQGHIQIRPPQYNRVPSSVFYRMFRLKKELGIQIYPQFLEDLYTSQVDSILTRVGILEDEIRMYGLAMSKATDDDVASFINSTSTLFNNKQFTLGRGAPFRFISDPDTGKVPTLSMISQDILSNATPNKNTDAFFAPLDPIKIQATVNNILSVSAQYNLIASLSQNSQNQTVSSIITNNKTRADVINSRLEQTTGQRFDLSQLFTNSQQFLGGTTVADSDRLRILQEMANRAEERQRLLKIAAYTIKNAKEAVTFENDQSTNKLFTPDLFGNKNLPQVFEHMIEDESYDDYGPGSGSRYIIKDYQIISIDINEEPPPYTSVEVHGRLGDNFIPPSNLPADLNAFKGGGNALSTAAATDYDLWRMYGLRFPQPIEAPYLTNPETQCAPFAVAILNKARGQIFKGSITIAGNEYMQPGDVVYIEDRDLLFYVTDVNHTINYGRSFQTTLTVTFGHMPGQYIPTYLDVIGKVLYKNKEVTNFVHKKQGNVNNEQHIGAIIGNADSIANLTDAANSIMNGSERNQQTLTNMLQAIKSAFSTTIDNNFTPIVEIRTYHSKTNGSFGSPDPGASALASAVQDYLLGKSDTPNLVSVTTQDSPETFGSNFKDLIRLVQVDSSNPLEKRSPSSAAFGLARGAAAGQATGSVDPDIVDNVIYTQIVDCWVVFTNPVSN